MKGLSSLAAICAALLFVSLCVGLMTAGPAIAQGGGAGNKDVRVINTAAEAIPTTITNVPAVQVNSLPAVQISGTPTVNVGNAPNVNVLSVPAVQIGNGAGNPVPVSVTNLPPQQSSGERRMLTGTFTIDPGIFGSVHPLWTVPAGKRLLIEFASFQVQDLGAAGVKHYAAVYAGDGQGFVAADGRLDRAEVGSEQLALFASAGELVAFGLFRDSILGVESHVQFTITGSLVDMP